VSKVKDESGVVWTNLAQSIRTCLALMDLGSRSNLGASSNKPLADMIVSEGRCLYRAL
jgi:hypothetical protein